MYMDNARLTTSVLLAQLVLFKAHLIRGAQSFGISIRKPCRLSLVSVIVLFWFVLFLVVQPEWASVIHGNSLADITCNSFWMDSVPRLLLVFGVLADVDVGEVAKPQSNEAVVLAPVVPVQSVQLRAVAGGR